jgi:uncharacterized protein YndB with AHSA1/START domain
VRRLPGRVVFRRSQGIVVIVIRKRLEVAVTPERAFDVFTGGLSRWWPLREYSFGGTRAAELLMEPRVSGRFFERFIDGDEFTVGEVTSWDPPSAVAFTWKQPDWPAPTAVSVTFRGSETGTVVELEHTGWEAVGYVPGDRISYDSGWDEVLAAYSAHAALQAG